MWHSLKPIEVEEQKRALWSQGEVCYITGLSPERILTWHKLNLIPETRTQMGRGNRRKYSFYQLAYLTAMRSLAGRGMAVSDAAWFAEHLFVERITEALIESAKLRMKKRLKRRVQCSSCYTTSGGRRDARVGISRSFARVSAWDLVERAETRLVYR